MSTAWLRAPIWFERILTPAVFYLLLIAGNALAQSGTRIMEWKIGCAFTTRVNRALFQSFLRNRSTRIGAETGELINVLKEDVEALEEDYVSAWLDFFINLISLAVFSLTIVFYLDWRILVTVFVGSALICFIPKLFQAVLTAKRKASISGQKDYLKALLDLLEGRAQYSMRNEKGYVKQHDDRLESAQKARFVFGKWRTISDTTADIGTQVVRFVTLLVAVFLFHRGEMTLGGVFAAIAFAGNFLAPIESMLSSLNAIFSVGESREAVESYLTPSPSPNQRNFLGGMKKSFHREESDVTSMEAHRLILQDVEIDREAVKIGPVSGSIPFHRHILITGANGSGKSSLLNAISGTLDYEGAILLDGVDIEEYERASFMQTVRVDEHIFCASLRDNLSYFGAVELHSDLVDAYLAALDKVVRERLLEVEDCTQLSSGQKQIVAILRALNLRPSLLILDEAFASMDAYHRQSIRTFLKSETAAASGRKLTIIEVAHDLTPEERAEIDEVFELDAMISVSITA